MKKIFLLLVSLVIMFSVPFTGSGTSKGSLFEFANILSFVIDDTGSLDSSTDSSVLYTPSNGGWFAVEILAQPSEMPSETSFMNAEKALKVCIEIMSAQYSNVTILRNDIIETSAGFVFHLQDVSYMQDQDYLIFSNGVLLWTNKGVIALWFADFPNNYISDNFFSSILQSLSINIGDDKVFIGKKVFTDKQIHSIVSAEKLHRNHAETNVKYQHLYRTSVKMPVQGESSYIADFGHATRVWMDSKHNRSIFAVATIIEILTLNEDLWPMIASKPITYTARNSSSIISSFFFSGSQVVSLEYDEKTSTVTAKIEDVDIPVVTYLENLKKKKAVVSYYENDKDYTDGKIQEIIDSLNKKQAAESRDTATAKPVQTETAKVQNTPKPSSSSAGVTPAFKAQMDAYETFVDDYIDFMKSFKESKDTVSLMADYVDFLSKYSEFANTLDDIDESNLNAADLRYYTEVYMRILKKLSEINLD